jgi:hypothetical protein
MIYPGVDEALDAIIQTVEEEIAPHVQDDLASSLCRTVAQMLRSVRVRITHEPAALSVDNAALRDLLATWAPELPAGAATAANMAAAQAPPPMYASMPDLAADALRLRAALVVAIEAVPETDHAFRKAARAYLTQQLSHEKVWLQDAFTGPRR